MVLAQQGSQIGSIFGPGGAVVGAVIAGGGLIATALFGLGDGLSAAERASSSFKAAMDGVNDTVGKGITSAEKLASAYAAMNAGQREHEAARRVMITREQTAALAEQERTLDGLLTQLERAATLGGFSIAGRTGDFGGDLPALRQRQGAIGAFRAGGDAGALVQELQRIAGFSPALQELANEALKASTQAVDLRAQLGELGEASTSLQQLSTGAGQELGRLEGMLQRIDQAVDTTTMSFHDPYQDVVGGSDVPYRLGSMIAHGKTKLEDFAASPRTSWARSWAT